MSDSSPLVQNLMWWMVAREIFSRCRHQRLDGTILKPDWEARAKVAKEAADTFIGRMTTDTARVKEG